MPTDYLERLSIRGYKSIRDLDDFHLRRLNVLIGANGSGKSNFIGFFRLLSQMIDGSMNLYVGRNGGADSFLYYGRKRTPVLSAELYFGNNGYKFELQPTQENRFVYAREAFYWNVRGDMTLGMGHDETKAKPGAGGQVYDYVVPPIRSWQIFHFHDTGENAPVKGEQALNENQRLRFDAGNLAAFLYRLKYEKRRDYYATQKFVSAEMKESDEPAHTASYEMIVRTVRLVVPFFKDFLLRPKSDNAAMIQLEWQEQGDDFPFRAAHLSDGTLRFICLATLLLQPDDFMPSTIIIDEPELGLHPYAIRVLADLVKRAAERHQVIVSTQSVELLNEFTPQDVVVVDRVDGQTSLHRLTDSELGEWLDDYSLGDLWKSNQFGGRPA